MKWKNLYWLQILKKNTEKSAGPRLLGRGEILQLPEVTSVAAEYVELDKIIDS